MLRFECDYGEGAAPAVLELMQKTNFDQTPGYGEDSYCAAAADKIRALCDAPDAAVHFFVGATQANLTVIDAALKPWQGVLCADSGHIHVHETGAVEATGHKCLALPNKNGKITARQIRHAVEDHRANASHEHEVQPGMVYISNPTEVGTLYTKAELTDISAACYELGLYLFVDGARMAYGLTSPANDLADRQAMAIRKAFEEKGVKLLHDSYTNQQFFVLPDEWHEVLSKDFAMTHMGKPDKTHTAVRICTSWATKAENVETLIEAVKKL